MVAQVPLMRPKRDVALELMSAHFRLVPELVEILRFDRDEELDEPIQLLEISRNGSDGTADIHAFGFGPADDITYPLVLAEITERKRQLVRLGVLSLPEGWRLADSKIYRREDLDAWRVGTPMPCPLFSCRMGLSQTNRSD